MIAYYIEKSMKIWIQCPKYGQSCYKLKDNNGDDNDNVSKKCPPTKVLWYLPIISRFKRLFTNENDTKDTIWHANEIKCDGNIFHANDSL